MDLVAMEGIVRATGNNNLLLKFQTKIPEKDGDLKELKEDIFQRLLEEKGFVNAMSFAKEEGISQELIVKTVNTECLRALNNNEHCRALELAKEYELGEATILLFAKARFDRITEMGTHDPSPAIKLAQNELKNEPGYLEEAVLTAYTRWLRWEMFSELQSLVADFPNLIDQTRKDLVEFLTSP